jgi:hypothetical protein
MRAIALFALLVLLPASAAAQEQTGYKDDGFAISCSFRDHPRMTLVDAPPAVADGTERTKIAAWSDTVPSRGSGPPATLNFIFMRPGRGGSPWMIIPSITYSLDVTRASAARGLLWIDDVPAPAPFTLNLSMPDTEGPVLQAEMDDAWYGRVFRAGEARAEVHDRTGMLTGSYRWDLTAMAAGLRAIENSGWACKPPR